MTPTKIVAIHNAVNELSVCVLPYRNARDVNKLKRKVQDEIDTIVSAEKAIVEKHSGQFTDTGFKFNTEEDAKAFRAEYENFMSQDAEVDLPKIDLSQCADLLRLTPNAIDSLDGIVNFGDG